MEIRARFEGFEPGHDGARPRYTFSGDAATPEELDAISGRDLRLRAVPWRDKRSLRANAYCWELLGKMAVELKTTKEELYELKLAEHGPLAEDEGGNPIVVALRPDVDPRALPCHWRRNRVSDDGKLVSYVMLKGSSRYDSKEMAGFIDMLIGDCRELGVETLPPDDIERMKRDWEAEGARGRA